MTGTDKMMIDAVRDRRPFEYGSREVLPEGDKVLVSLHGAPCARVDFDKGIVTVHGQSLKSRKSSKVFNAVLRTYTDSYAQNRDGRWELVVPVGLQVDFNGNDVSVPISRE